jgi:ABC-type dipeptide/oligopeptide/nickel transport system ATPase subunit
MGKRGRKPGTKQDGVSKLERSRMSARECRVRKKLRYEYLEELVQDREKTIIALKHELELYRKVCEKIDNGEISDELRRLVASNWHIKTNENPN